MPVRRDVFQAIADPTRREIIRLVAAESMNLNAIADRFQVSRPAISKHIKILTECGLVKVNVRGRDHFCEAQLQQLSEVNAFVEQFRRFWEDKFDALEAYLAELQSQEKQDEA